MAKLKIDFLVEDRRAAEPVFRWVPSPRLRAAGWRQFAIRGEDGKLVRSFLEAAPIAEAQNAKVAAWRGGTGPGPDTRAPHGPKPAVAGSVDALIQAYKASPAYLNLKPRVRRQYARHLGKISAWAGPEPAAAITESMVDDLYAKLRAHSPSEGHYTIRVLRRLYSRGIRMRLVSRNPAAKPELKGLPRGGIIWPDAAVERLVATADRIGRPGLGDAILVNYWCGLNSVDLVALPRLSVEGGAVRISRSKTGAGLALPIGMVPQLAARIAAAAERRKKAKVEAHPERATMLVNDETGQPYTADQLRRAFAEVRAALVAEMAAEGRAAEIPVEPGSSDTVAIAALMFKHLRHSAIVRLCEAGCTDELISAITGHSLATIKSVLEHYLTRTAKMARLAFRKRLDAEEGEE